MLNSFLREFGLTANEQAIYLFLLSHGYSMASTLSKRLGIKRVTVYSSLESMKLKNIITSFKKNNINYFEAVAPEKIVTLCEEKITRGALLKKEAEAIFPELKKLEQMQTMPVIEVRGKIKYYQGAEAVKGLIVETLEEPAKEQLCFGLNEYHVRHPRDWKLYTKKRIALPMRVRSIQPNVPVGQAYKKRDSAELRVTRLVPQKKFPAQCELNIIGDMIALFTMQQNEPTGAKIYNKVMAQVLRSIFELAWERAEKYDDGN